MFKTSATIANFFDSLSLYLDGTYAVGDYVVLETGERGRVEDRPKPRVRFREFGGSAPAIG